MHVLLSSPINHTDTQDKQLVLMCQYCQVAGKIMIIWHTLYSQELFLCGPAGVNLKSGLKEYIMIKKFTSIICLHFSNTAQKSLRNLLAYMILHNTTFPRIEEKL